MFNGEILSFGISQKPSAENIMSALDEAITITNDCSYRRTFHSDRGWAYQMKALMKKQQKDSFITLTEEASIAVRIMYLS